MGTGSFPGVNGDRGVTLTPQPLLVPWSWKCRAIPLLPLCAVRPVHSLSTCPRVTFTFTFTLYAVQQHGRCTVPYQTLMSLCYYWRLCVGQSPDNSHRKAELKYISFRRPCVVTCSSRQHTVRPPNLEQKGPASKKISETLLYFFHSFIHSAVCLTTGPKPLPNQLSTRCDLELPPSNENILSFP